MGESHDHSVCVDVVLDCSCIKHPMGLALTIKTAYSTTASNGLVFWKVLPCPLPTSHLCLGLEGRRKEKHFFSSPMHKRKPFHGQIHGLSSFIHQGYYKRTPDYLPIYNRERVGCFQVPVVHSTMLIDLRSQRSDASRQLTYWPAPEGFKGPVDDVVQFAFSAKKEGAL